MVDEKVALHQSSSELEDRTWHKIQDDPALEPFYTFEVEIRERTHDINGRQVVEKVALCTVSCKSEACAATWDLVLSKSGQCPPGPKNSLISHAQKHAPGYIPPFRRRS